MDVSSSLYQIVVNGRLTSYLGCFERGGKGLVDTVCACSIFHIKWENRISYCFITVNLSAYKISYINVHL